MTDRSHDTPPVHPHDLTRNPGLAVTDAVSALADSSAGLRRAASLIGDESASAALVEMSDLRHTAARRLSDAASETDLSEVDPEQETAEGAVTRGWMRLESAVDGDQDVMEAARAEESEVREVLRRVLVYPLPEPVAAAARNAIEQISDGIALLDEWLEEQEKK